MFTGLLKSKGHLAFGRYMLDGGRTRTIEFFKREGIVYEAPIDNVVMPDGYRCGRFLCAADRYESYKRTFLSRFEKVEEADE